MKEKQINMNGYVGNVVKEIMNEEAIEFKITPLGDRLKEKIEKLDCKNCKEYNTHNEIVKSIDNIDCEIAIVLIQNTNPVKMETIAIYCCLFELKQYGNK